MATRRQDHNGGLQQTFPLMKLPAELRLLIYEFTLDDTLTHIASLAQGPRPMQVLPRGTLALLLTSKPPRAECSEGILPLLSVYDKITNAHYERIKHEQVQERIRVKNQPAHLRHSSAFIEEASRAESRLNRRLCHAYRDIMAACIVTLAAYRALPDLTL